jgi:hypothetical protein
MPPPADNSALADPGWAYPGWAAERVFAPAWAAQGAFRKLVEPISNRETTVEQCPIFHPFEKRALGRCSPRIAGHSAAIWVQKAKEK